MSGDAAATDEAAAPHAAAPGSDGTPAHASWPAPDALMRRLVQLVAHLSRALTKAVRQQCTTAAPSAAGDSAGADAGAVAGAVAGAGAGAVAGPAAGAGGARAAPHADVLAGWESWDDYQMGHVADDQAGGSSAKPAAGKRIKKENGSVSCNLLGCMSVVVRWLGCYRSEPMHNIWPRAGRAPCQTSAP